MRLILARVLPAVVVLVATTAGAELDRFGLGNEQDKGGGDTITVNGVINSYAQVTGPLAPGDTVIPVSTITGFAAGDLVMVLQTTGIVPPASSGNQLPVDLASDPVGRWELARVGSVSTNPAPRITLTAPLMNSYAAQVTQLVFIPEYKNVKVDGGALSAQAWNGSTGGVLAFLATGSLTLKDKINVAGQGFQGGLYARQVVSSDAGVASCSSPTNLDLASPEGGRKGEGIDSTRFPSSSGKGNIANGGGGGNCTQAGGGGGGHGGLGGNGGGTPAGLGGAPLAYSLLDHLGFGGGGGSGQGTAAYVTPPNGGSGGGIIFIRAGSVVYDTGGGGSSKVMDASGSNGAASNSVDGAGGGGAGGTVVLRVTGDFDCRVAILAKGAAGGNATSTPGGGGGGGRILLQAGSLSNTATPCNWDIGGGSAGTSGGGAQGGGSGGISVLPGGFPSPGTPNLTAPPNLTKDPKPLISGNVTLPPPNIPVQVDIYMDGSWAGWTTTTTSGNFSFKVPFSLGDGAHSVEAASLYQSVQSVSRGSRTFTVDTVPPTVTVTSVAGNPAASGMTVASQQPLIEGTSSEAGSTVTVTIGGNAVQVNHLANGAWESTPSLSEGLNTISVVATDPAGNTNPTAFQFQIYADTIAPSRPEVIKVSGKDVAPTATSVAVNSRSLALEGTAEVGAKVKVQIGTAIYETRAASSGAGAWSMVLPPAAADGSLTVVVSAEDLVGWVGTPRSLEVFVDTAPPDTTITESPTRLVNSPVAEFVFTGSDGAGSGVARYDCTLIKICSGVTSVSTQTGCVSPYIKDVTCSDGDMTMLVSAVDNAGNQDPWPDSYSWRVVSGQFVADLSAKPPRFSNAPVSNFTFDSNFAGVTYFCTVENLDLSPAQVVATKCYKDCPVPPPDAGCFNLPNGHYRISVHAMVGNLTSSNVGHEWWVDTTAPAAPNITSPSSDGQYIKQPQLVVSGSAVPDYSAEQLVAVISVDGVDVTVPVTASGEWSRTFSLVDGLHDVQVKIVDGAKNETSPVRRSLRVDTVPPQARIVSAWAPQNVSLPLGGATRETTARFVLDTTEPEASFEAFECELDATSVPCSAGVGGFEVTGLREDRHTLRVLARDKAGNVSDPPATWTWVVDRTPPETQIITGPNPVVLANPEIFNFSVANSELGGVTYFCSLDSALFQPCANPLNLPVLPEGEHSLQVKARDDAGNEDESPASWSWEVDATGNTRAYGGGLSCAATSQALPLVAMLGLMGLLMRTRRRSP